MKVFGIILLLITFHTSAKAGSGVIVKILPDKLVLDSSCQAIADLQSKDFSILYACKDSYERNYFYNFRLNDGDLVDEFKKSSTEVVVSKSQFKSYTLYEITAKNFDNKPIRFVSYCTKEICLDLVSDNKYEQSIQDSITSQLQE
ncbi:MAG: hypothetical protein OQJ89_03860 [Kangiellaceae bacterium]|nr:hypothetical protein [Kangiellaceae bacterium]MCW9016075.1 hypothetical protein [Kangiellaceae bacterium]